MNRNFIIVLLSFFTSLFGCNKNKIIPYSDFKTNLGGRVLVQFQNTDIQLGKLIEIKTSSRLQSKVKTIFCSTAFFETTIFLDDKPVILGFSNQSSVPITLRSKNDKRPYINKAEKKLKEDIAKLKSVDYYVFKYDSSFLAGACFKTKI